jgi:hypothetical protein
MVKDDLEAFHSAYDFYHESSSWEAIKTFFKGVPNPILYGFWFTLGASLVFTSILAGLLFTIASTGQKDNVLFAIMGILGVMATFYFYLLKQHGIAKDEAQPYRRLLTHTYYQYDRYFMFKEKLDNEYKHKAFPFEKVKALIQSRLQLDQGLGVLRVWLLGVSASVLVTIIYSLAPGNDGSKVAYIAIISFFVLLSLFYAYFVHDPFWFKNNKYRELLHFITLYETESANEE